MVDTHSHLYLKDFTVDIENVMIDAIASGVTRIFLPAIDQETHEDVIALHKKYPDVAFPMMGLHPCSVKDNFEEEMHLVREYLNSGAFYGVGESGLDYYWDLTYKEEQVEALRQHIQLAIAHGLPLILHTRNSIDDTLAVVEEYAGNQLKGIFHCFGGTLEQANRIIDLGFYIGIGGVVTYKNGGLQQVLPDIPLSKIVLETDAPYLTPVPHRGRRNESKYLRLIAEKVAEIKHISFEEVEEVTTLNAGTVFAKAFNS